MYPTQISCIAFNWRGLTKEALDEVEEIDLVHYLFPTDTEFCQDLAAKYSVDFTVEIKKRAAFFRTKAAGRVFHQIKSAGWWGTCAERSNMSKLSRMIKWEFQALSKLLSIHPQSARAFQSGFSVADFILDEATGTFRHRVKEGVFCGVCVPAHRVYARMNKGHGGWTCFTCGKQYADPAPGLVPNNS